MFKSLFDKETRKQRSLDKAIAKVVNNKLKPDDRRPSLDVVLRDGSEACVSALLTRLTFSYQNNAVADEEEKNLVYQGLLALPHEAARERADESVTPDQARQEYKAKVMLPALRDHLAKAPSLSWGLRLLGEVCDHDETWQVLADVLAKFDAEYTRDPSRKEQLLTYIREFKDERVVPAIMPFVSDYNETVRFLALEAIFDQDNAEEAREVLLKQLTDDEEESRRIRNRIAEAFVATGWTVKGFRGSVESVLEGDFVVDGKGRIKPKKGK